MSSVAIFIFVGLLTAAHAVPMALRKVPPNRLYGLRVRATLADEVVWYAANARSGRDLILVGGVFAAFALALSFAGLSKASYSMVCAVVLVILLLGAAIRGWLFAEKCLRDRPPGPGAAGSSA
jgi:uncharacterized membrane protein